MSVRNQHARQTKNYIIEVINGVTYYIEPDTYKSKSLIYQAKNKINNGKLVIDEELVNSGKPILVICQGNGNFKTSLI